MSVVHFTDKDTGRPIEGTPEPLSCPFCGHTDVAIATTDSKQAAFVECQHCGVQGAYAGTDENETPPARTLAECVLEAARRWNHREGSLAALGAVETPIAERIGNLFTRLTAARSAVSITTQALDHGETDLELHAAEVLAPAAESLDDILNELIVLRIDAAHAEEVHA